MEEQTRRKDNRSLNRRGNEGTSSSSVPTSPSSETEGRNSESEGRTNDTEHHKKLVLLKLPHNEAEEEDSPKGRRSRSTLRRRSKEESVKCSCGVGTEPYG
ncbi:uncharacterized protein [Rhodnius prolixus]|uniref:uncharacterized protein n=1 Tax=Rhodnius prolixus TaxID=13249 RepID=UPI003D18B814